MLSVTPPRRGRLLVPRSARPATAPAVPARTRPLPRTGLLVALTALLTGLVLPLLAVAPADAARAAGHQRGTVPFWRERVAPGAQDNGPYDIAHVVEVQRRLEMLGLFKASVTGYYGDVTTHAVKRFQHRKGLRVSGVMTKGTWKALILATLKNQKAVPKSCKHDGWHACYDRAHHQLSLYHGGTMINSWLVRGGDYTVQTRTGRFRVYKRDIDHVSGLYNTPMPYSQFFSGGQAIHGSRYMTDPFIDHSHGCVNMYVEDARVLWKLTATHKLIVHNYGKWD